MFLASPICKPLGGFVVLSVVFGLCIIINSVKTMNASPSGDAKNDLMILTVLGAIHITYSFYIQWRLVMKLEGGETGAGARTLAQNAGQIVMYDIGFCLYGVAWCVSGFFALKFCGSCCSGAVKSGGQLMLAYQILSGMYGVAWSCLVACCGAAESMTGNFSRRRAHGSTPSAPVTGLPVSGP
jgi:hypothetical protein